MTSQGAYGVSPEPIMEQVSELSLTLGGIYQSADVLTVEDLRHVCKVACSLAGSSAEPTKLQTEADLRELLMSCAKSLQGNPSKLAEVAETVDAAARERFKQNLAKHRGKGSKRTATR